MIISGIVKAIKEKKNACSSKLKGSVVLMRRSVLDVTDLNATVLDNVHELFGKGIGCQLVSSTDVDPNNGNRGRVGAEAYLKHWVTNLPSLTAGDSKFKVSFHWDVEKQGVPGAVIVKNHHSSEFFLKTITIDDVPGRGTVVFVANSWVYPASKYHCSRVFFTNDSYLPREMPAALRPYREDELRYLRGDDRQGPYKEHERVYRYDVYNDLSEPGSTGNRPRPVLGGSDEHPYPRRCRTGRSCTRADPSLESRLPGLEQNYVPRDEMFGGLKRSDIKGFVLKAATNGIVPAIRAYVDQESREFDSFDDIMGLYKGGLKLPNIPGFEELKKRFPVQLIRDLLPVGGKHIFKLPVPQIIKEDKSAWRTDEEFAREMLAGANPLIIKRLADFPPRSTLDPSKFGDQTSKITTDHIQRNLEGLSVQQALDGNRLYILDHHDNLMPFLEDINKLDDTFVYATRTLLLLKSDGTLKPLAIELSLPSAESKVYTPASAGVEASIWQLAKAYVAVNDSGWHQLVSHWLNTHAVMEPFVIATNRQLSVAHPVHKLLQPHYRDTIAINAMARQVLINAGGIFEQTVFHGRYALAMSSAVYKTWNFTEQSLPDDLIKRGMAVPDASSPHKMRLLIEDYPYATDGLAVWAAIEQWVAEYCAIYYPDDELLQDDAELQAWWKEVREVGHGDIKDRSWWPEMSTVAELVRSCSTIIWIASALHAAVNFGQYPYGGFSPNRPTVSRRRMPEPGMPEYAELERDPDRVLIHTITSQSKDGISIYPDIGEAAFGRIGRLLISPENLNLNFIREHNQMSSSGGNYTSSKGTTEREFMILNLLEFDSKRKRMPVILKDEYGQILLLYKGANSSLFQPSSIIFDRLAKSGSLFEPDISNHLNEYGDAGLWTLALTYRVLEESECSSWNADFLKAETSIEPNKRIATRASLRFD